MPVLQQAIAVSSATHQLPTVMNNKSRMYLSHQVPHNSPLHAVSNGARIELKTGMLICSTNYFQLYCKMFPIVFNSTHSYDLSYVLFLDRGQICTAAPVSVSHQHLISQPQHVALAGVPVITQQTVAPHLITSLAHSTTPGAAIQGSTVTMRKLNHPGAASTVVVSPAQAQTLGISLSNSAVISTTNNMQGGSVSGAVVSYAKQLISEVSTHDTKNM